MVTQQLPLLLLCVLCVCLCYQGTSAVWWMDQPYGNKEYNNKIEFTNNVTLLCNDTLLDPGYSVQYWIRPDLQIMEPGMSQYFWTLDGYAGWMVDSTGQEMIVTTLQEAQFGFYHCVMNDSSGNIHVVKKAINYEKAYFGDLWQKYRMNTIIAGGSAGGFLVLCLIILLTCKFLVHDDEEEQEGSSFEDDLKAENPMEGSSSNSSDHSDSMRKGPPPKDIPAYQPYVQQDLEMGKVNGLSQRPERSGDQGYTNLAYGAEQVHDDMPATQF